MSTATDDSSNQDPLDPAVATDGAQQRFGFGPGGVPWYLLLFYLGFLVFFTWYVLEFQLADYLEQGPGQAVAVEAESP